MSMRGAVAGCLVLACLVALLAERTDGHITFFSPKEMMLMKEREGRKDMEPRSEDGQFEDVTVQQLPPRVEHGGTPVSNTPPSPPIQSPNTQKALTPLSCVQDKTVEFAVRLSPKQLDHVVPVLEDIIHGMVEQHQKAK